MALFSFLGDRNSPGEELEKADERLITREMAKLLMQKGVSYHQAVRIFKDVKNLEFVKCRLLNSEYKMFKFVAVTHFCFFVFF